jgi:hypothetical protein
MKPLIRIIALAGILATTHLRAQPYPIFTQLTLQQQGDTTVSGGVYTDRVRTTRLTSYELLALLEPFYSSDFPNGFPYGARLVLMDFSRFQVESISGAVLVTNTAPYLTYTDTYRQTNYLYSGKENTAYDSLKETFLYQATITFQDPSPSGTSFTFTGNMMEKYSRSAPDFYGDQLAQGSFILNGFGSGKTGPNFFLLSGKFSTPVVRWLE